MRTTHTRTTTTTTTSTTVTARTLRQFSVVYGFYVAKTEQSGLYGWLTPFPENMVVIKSSFGKFVTR